MDPSYGMHPTFRGAGDADTHSMTDASVSPPATGANMIVVEMNGPQPVQRMGVVAKVRENAIALRLEGASFRKGDEVVCITAGRPRFTVRARFLASQGAVCGFQLLSPWRILEVRENERHRVSLAAEVRSVLGTSRQAGELIDISTGGAAVVVPSRPGGRQLEVSLSAGGYAATLPCELAGAEEQAESVLLHLKFEQLSPAQRAFVRGVIAAAQATRMAAEEAAS